MRQSFRLAVHAGVLAQMTIVVLAGRATAAQLPPDAEAWHYAAAQEVASSVAAAVPVVRRGRYTLVELVPGSAQRDLMRQVVEVSIPSSLDATVGDGLRHVLRRSGYRLCASSDAAALYALPLPAAHLHLGPLMLRDALLTIAGPAWDLSVDDVGRVVCFARQDGTPSRSATPTSQPASAVSPISAPATGGDREVRP